jgi:hypothetical protein
LFEFGSLANRATDRPAGRTREQTNNNKHFQIFLTRQNFGSLVRSFAGSLATSANNSTTGSELGNFGENFSSVLFRQRALELVGLASGKSNRRDETKFTAAARQSREMNYIRRTSSVGAATDSTLDKLESVRKSLI